MEDVDEMILLYQVSICKATIFVVGPSPEAWFGENRVSNTYFEILHLRGCVILFVCCTVPGSLLYQFAE